MGSLNGRLKAIEAAMAERDEPEVRVVMVELGGYMHETRCDGHTLTLAAPCPPGWWEERREDEDAWRGLLTADQLARLEAVTDPALVILPAKVVIFDTIDNGRDSWLHPRTPEEAARRDLILAGRLDLVPDREGGDL